MYSKASSTAPPLHKWQMEQLDKIFKHSAFLIRVYSTTTVRILYRVANGFITLILNKEVVNLMVDNSLP